jgi:hypothetical protein
LLASSSAADAGSGPSSAPEESDIWKTRGDKIYFFNRLRGLQIIDASDPAEPLMLGRLSLAGAGEEMYLLGNDPAGAESAVLVTGLPWTPATPEATRINRIALPGDQPALETSIELPGYYVDSRLTGGLLHVITASWLSASGQWLPRTFLTTLDVSAEGQIIASMPREFELAPQAAGSTGKYFWFAGSSAGSSSGELLLFPYRSDNSLAGPLRTGVGGRVQDKFKVGDTADGVAVVVQNWADWRQVTSVETYAVDDGDLVPRGNL